MGLLEDSWVPPPASMDDVFFIGPPGSRSATRILRERISMRVPIPERWAALRTAVSDSGPWAPESFRMAPFVGPTAHLPVYDLAEFDARQRRAREE